MERQNGKETEEPTRRSLLAACRPPCLQQLLICAARSYSSSCHIINKKGKERGTPASSISCMRGVFRLSLLVSLLASHASAMVSLHGRTALRPVARAALRQGLHEATERPPDPHTLLSTAQMQEKVDDLLQWFHAKTNILTLTGAGLSTESGVPDYRGHNGSYHWGHKPMIHDQFMSSPQQRQRYWGRGMAGWRYFDTREPNAGHYALVSLERLERIGVTYKDKAEYYPHDVVGTRSSDFRRLSLITQNVDSLHRRAGSMHVTELHGRTDRLKCMQCGAHRDRKDFHNELEDLNREWLEQALAERDEMSARPDGDAHVASENFSDVVVPACTQCGDGFLKPDVVFFGDSVPKHRVERCRAAVDAADGLLCVGSSLAVHSAFRFVKAAHTKGIPICILNVGETRAETEGLDVIKIEAPAGPTLAACAAHFRQKSEREPNHVANDLS